MNRIRYARRIHDSEYTPYVKGTHAGVKPKVPTLVGQAIDVIANADIDEMFPNEMSEYTTLTLKDVKAIVKRYITKSMFTKEELEAIYDYYNWGDPSFSLNEAFNKFLNDVAKATKACLDY